MDDTERKNRLRELAQKDTLTNDERAEMAALNDHRLLSPEEMERQMETVREILAEVLEEERAEKRLTQPVVGGEWTK